MNEFDDKFKLHKRDEVEPATIEVQRFTVDDNPVCMAWYGLGSHKRMACRFLASSHMGSKYHCLVTGDEIFSEENGGLSPTKSCPVWP